MGEFEGDGGSAEILVGVGAAGLGGVDDGEASGMPLASSGRWWSVTMRSRPSARASAAAAKARMPVSTLMTRRTPAAAARPRMPACMP